MNNGKENVLIMKVLGNAHRIEILRFISKSKNDLCVNQIASAVGISQSLASHQLAYLSAHGVVEGHRVGQTICYTLTSGSFSKKVCKVLKVLLS